MRSYQKKFLEFCLRNKIIQFGEFTLKSGRISPYFFNSGLFNCGAAIAELGKFYADAIANSGIQFDVLFGPAYKGIPLVVTASIALAEKYHLNRYFSFNRKAAKDHGEGSNIVGAPLNGKILVVDDVITAGTAINEAAALIKGNNAELTGICVALDRREKGPDGRSAIDEIQEKYDIRVISIVTLDDLLAHIEQMQEFKIYFDRIKVYLDRYRASSSS